MKLVDDFLPEVIINTAAITNVDLCETERALAWKVNVVGVENLVHAARMVGAKIIHFSTDYVFDGKSGPYNEGDRVNPMSYYGRTKLASENVLRTSEIPHTIIRTMILYGIGKQIKDNFALWLVNNLKDNKQVRVVDDQIGNPTLVDDLAYAVLKVVEFDKNGLYHIAGNDLVSRYDFAFALAKKFKLDKNLIIPIKTAILKQPAPRPMKSGFIILKAETELSIKMSGVEQGLTIFQNQLNHIYDGDLLS
jgi:dTDP-4-dehydrorhamnose reductase